jgi:sec-independent protein translocase protein TatA
VDVGFLRGIGPLEIILILVVVMIVFGVGRLPEVGSGLGKGIREFKKQLTNDNDKVDGSSEDGQKST